MNLILSLRYGEPLQFPQERRSGDTSPTRRRRKDDNLTDGEYRRWLLRPYDSPTFTTLCGISLKPYDYKDIEARVPEHLRSEPLKPFTGYAHTLDLALVGDCMQLYLYRLLDHTLGRDKLSGHLWDQTYDLSTFRACLINDDAGAKALSWLLHSGEVDRIEATINIRSMQAITLCLVGEGRTDVWWDMLKIQHTAKRGIDATVHEKPLSSRWCSMWFTSILEAKTFWATGPSKFNDPLTTFLQVIRFSREERTIETMIPITGPTG